MIWGMVMMSSATISLESIQVGDWVKIKHGDQFATVTHTTPKQFVAGGYSFWKKDGRSLQTFGYSDMRFYALIATHDEVKKDLEAKEQWRLVCELADILHEYGSKIPLETLREWHKTATALTEADNE
jgi:hypothetical protein